MKLFGNVLFWIVLFLLGALAAQFLLQDTGSVLVRYGGYDYHTSIAAAAAGLLGALIVLVETKDTGKREAWAKRGAAFFQGKSRRSASAPDRDAGGALAQPGGAQPASGGAGAA